MSFRMYKMAVGFMLAHPYGFTRVMSSYRWTRHFVDGTVSFGVVQNILRQKSQEIEVNFVITSHIAITFTIYFIKYLLSENLRQGSCNNAVDKKIEMNDLC